MQLTPHFSLAEFTRSDTARIYGLSNAPRPEHLANLRILASFLEQVRALPEVGNRPVTIESAYRSPEVNAHPDVGGVPTSDHCKGLAADIEVAGMSDLDLAIAIRDSSLKFDQLIREDGRTIHVSINPRMRRQVLRQPGKAGTAVYDGLGTA